MALTNQELFEKGRPISSLFPIYADNGVIIEQQSFRCAGCEKAIPETNSRGFIIDKGDTLVSHIFCQCAHCQYMTVLSDAYEERMFGISLWKKSGSTWEHTQDIDIPKRYWPKILWVKGKLIFSNIFNQQRRYNTGK